MSERRPLTEEEKHILSLIRSLYGEKNTEEECFFPDDHAVIFVKSNDGSIPICVNLSVVSYISREGKLTDEEIIHDWLMPKD